MELSETLQKVRDGFVEKSAELEAIQKKATDQVRPFQHSMLVDLIQVFQANMMGNIVCCSFMKAKSMETILHQNFEKDREIASLRAEIAKLSQNSPMPPKTKRGLLANIREAVTSPHKGTTSRTLRKTVRTPNH